MSNSTDAAEEAEGIATIRAALDAGVTLLDTGDFYGTGHNEELIRRGPGEGRSQREVRHDDGP
jgi:pyridoxine 4-dehydrogenase